MNNRFEIWFWQTELSPHIYDLVCELRKLGHNVTYVAGQRVSVPRQQLGWGQSAFGEDEVIYASSASQICELVRSAPQESIHISQGIRGSQFVKLALRECLARGLRTLLLMETIEDSGPVGLLKRIYYSTYFAWNKAKIDGVLAIGQNASNWIVERGMNAGKVLPFAYFLKPPKPSDPEIEDGDQSTYKLVYVGQLIDRKRVEDLILAVAVARVPQLELLIVGGGENEKALRAMAATQCPGRVRWLGTVPMDEARKQIAKADCLVLPSRFDGWGAVISEALSAGTKVICSDTCGASTLLSSEGAGLVYPSGNVGALSECIVRMVARGPVNKVERSELAHWATAILAPRGALYLVDCFNHLFFHTQRPAVPWLSPTN